jgi:hypothetical protein
MKVWWFIGLVLLFLIALTLRESYTNYEEALKDVGQTAGYTSLTPKCPEGSKLNAEKTMCTFGNTSRADVVPTCEKDTLEFVNGTCRPKAQVVGTTSGTTAALPLESIGGGMTDAKCPNGSSPSMSDFKCPENGERPTCPPGSSLYTVFARGGVPTLKCVETSLVYDVIWSEGERTRNPCKNPSHLTGLFVPASGSPPLELPKCIATGTSSSNTTTTPGTATTTPASQSSTGGSSTSSYGPNSGGASGKGKGIFGPTFNGIGDSNGNVRPIDSSKINQYPELLGGGDSRPSTRIDGAGIVDPSKNWQLAMNGSLPNCTSLGCDENSKYLPYSRQPGDMELIPDPYRVSQQFSSASYSFKTEPTPFLTDFSAFLR